MNDLDFYKSIYDRELSRRKYLDSSISIPIGILSLLIGLVSYFYSATEYKVIINENLGVIILLAISILAMILSIIYLIKSYNNFLRGFNYKNLSYLKNIRKYQKVEIPEYNKKVSKEKQITFENKLIDRLINITDTNTAINDKRAFSMYWSKTFITIALAVLFIAIIYILIKQSKLC